MHSSPVADHAPAHRPIHPIHPIRLKLPMTLLLAGSLLGSSLLAQAQQTPPSPAAGTVAAARAEPMNLTQIGAMLDRALFDAYNRCDLQHIGALFAADVEFFHDQGGLMRTRDAIVDATQRNICGKTRRELVEGSLQSFEMKGYGLLQTGMHRFCPLEPGSRCGGIARFSHLWRGAGEASSGWQLTRVFSYDHRPLP